MVEILELKNDKLSIKVLNIGAILYEFNVLEKNRNIVLNFIDTSMYKNDGGYLGKVIAPTAGRIENASYSIGNVLYQLEKNEGENNLHSGINDISNVIFDYKYTENGLILFKKIEHNFYNFKVLVDYEIEYKLNSYTLNITHKAIPNKDMFINMTNHSYFNLNGSGNVLNNYIKVNADVFYKIKDNKIADIIESYVANTEFDLRKYKKLEDIVKDVKKGLYANQLGIDNPYKIIGSKNELKNVASIKNDDIELTIYSTEDVAVVYTGNFLDNCEDFKGIKANKYTGIAIEPQNHPNVIQYNKEYITKANEEYCSKIQYKIEI